MKIIAVAKAATILGISFSEAFDKQPIELLQLLSLKAQESFEEAHLLVRTHSMPAASIAQILAESFLKVCLKIFTCSLVLCSTGFVFFVLRGDEISIRGVRHIHCLIVNRKFVYIHIHMQNV